MVLLIRGNHASYPKGKKEHMDNVVMEVNGKTLVITVDLTAAGTPSSTGKTLLIASTRGAVPVVGGPRQEVKVALNVTVPVL